MADSWEDLEEVEVKIPSDRKTSDWSWNVELEEAKELLVHTKKESEKQAAIAEVQKKQQKKGQKVQLASKIQERELRESTKKRGLAGKAENEDELMGMSEAERKKFLEALEREADFQNAKELFGNGGVDESLDAFRPETDADLERFCTLISRKLIEVTNNRRGATVLNFYKALLKNVTGEMKVEDIKDLATHVNVLANEKLKANQEKKKGKQKKKAVVKVDAEDDLASLEDDYEDFM
ncbi:uncharacterized protein Gasu_09810 [Galdieria sulphuraria]|uniref:Uncharacterized protein n=1 Tax=Galdieria sulphuraria TaxID=130081 RepID=M2X607_GALSU|nr:uncharacterized protein Gasu_09810 [Galdieria sulphuraria]EME31915.1 hypothetical protein Gasu_09810 [Galdieria sulphuraria]|eukprot:XP_005708435.1 hypothetical protein Gasu_09810 [Galdieria sulphuraria]